MSHRHRTYCRRLAGYGIVQIASVYLAEAHAVTLHQGSQVTVQNLVGIRPVLVNVIARMTSRQSLDCHTEEEISFGSLHHRTGKFGRSARTACTSDKQFAFILRVKVQQNISVHETFFQRKGSRQSGFFVYGKQAFYRTVLYVPVCQHGQFRSHADSVVGTQRRTLCPQPIAVDVSFDRIGIEIMLHAAVLFADHIHVRLKHHCLQVFFSGRSVFSDQHIPCLIHFILQSVRFRKVCQILSDSLLLFRRTGYMTDFLKIMKNRCRLQIFFFHKIIV